MSQQLGGSWKCLLRSVLLGSAHISLHHLCSAQPHLWIGWVPFSLSRLCWRICHGCAVRVGPPVMKSLPQPCRKCLPLGLTILTHPPLELAEVAASKPTGWPPFPLLSQPPSPGRPVNGLSAKGSCWFCAKMHSIRGQGQSHIGQPCSLCLRVLRG